MTWLVGVLILIIAVLLVLLFSRQVREQAVGICNFTMEQSVKKSQNKQKILSLFEKEKSLSNEEIRDALGVSYRSVTRYMDDLEEEGKVRQIGETGRGVVYTLT